MKLVSLLVFLLCGLAHGQPVRENLIHWYSDGQMPLGTACWEGKNTSIIPDDYTHPAQPIAFFHLDNNVLYVLGLHYMHTLGAGALIGNTLVSRDGGKVVDVLGECKLPAHPHPSRLSRFRGVTLP